MDGLMDDKRTKMSMEQIIIKIIIHFIVFSILIG